MVHQLAIWDDHIVAPHVAGAQEPPVLDAHALSQHVPGTQGGCNLSASPSDGNRCHPPTQALALVSQAQTRRDSNRAMLTTGREAPALRRQTRAARATWRAGRRIRHSREC
eukprot:4858757-Prymnesium_polylepis.1